MLVGPKKQRFTVYHDILTERSGFFTAARSSRWTQDSQKPTDLTDHDPEDFSNYLQLVYGGGCIQPCEELSQFAKGYPNQAVTDVISELGSAHYMALFKLYILADKLEDLKSANLIMDDILLFGGKYTRMLGSMPTNFVYDRTPPNSTLRNLIRDTMVYENAGRHFLDEPFADKLPHQLLLDVVKEHRHIKFEQAGPHGSFSDVYEKRLSNFPKCRYHQHNDRHPECE